MSNLYLKLNIPPACKVDKPIFKKQFYDNVSFNAKDKELFSSVVDKIVWRYCLKPETINILPYKDEARDYPEIEVIEVVLKEEKGLRRIAEIIMRSIPYPMLLIFVLGGKTQLWAAHQRLSQSDSGKNTLEEFVITDWLTDESPLFAALDIKTMRFSNYFALYTDIVDAVSIFNASRLNGNNADLTGDAARLLVADIDALDLRIANLRAELKKETQFNRKVEMNVNIKRLLAEKNSLIKESKGND